MGLDRKDRKYKNIKNNIFFFWVRKADISLDKEDKIKSASKIEVLQATDPVQGLMGKGKRYIIEFEGIISPPFAWICLRVHQIFWGWSSDYMIDRMR